MEKKIFSKVMACAIACFSWMAVNSCVNEELEVSEENIDLSVQVFADGLQIPIGSTDSIAVGHLLKLVGGEQSIDSLLTEMDNGGYVFRMSGAYDLSDTLNHMLKSVKIDSINYGGPISVDLESIDLSDMKVSEMSFPEDGPFELKIADIVSVPEIPTLDPIAMEEVKVSAGVAKYVPDMGSIALPAQDIEKDAKILELPSNVDLSKLGMANDNPVSVDDLLTTFGRFGLSVETEFDESATLSLPLELPKGVTAVNEIKLHEDAALVVTIELINPLLSSGSIIPDVDIDLSSLLHLKGSSDDKAHLVNDLILSENSDPAKHYKASKKYPISSLAITKDDWMVDPSTGCAVLKPEKRNAVVTAKGEIDIKSCYTTTNLINQKRHLEVKLSIAFEKFEIVDVDMSVEPITMEKKQGMLVELPEISLAGVDVVKSIDKVIFDHSADPTTGKPQSTISLSLLPENFDRLEGLDITLETFEVSFPKGLIVKDISTGKITSDSDNVLSYSGADLSQDFIREIQVLEFNLPAPDPDTKIISYKDSIRVKAKVAVAGSVNTAALTALKKENKDIAFSVNAGGKFAIADYQASISRYYYDVGEKMGEAYDITIDLPEQMKDLGSVTVYPELINGKSPAITLDITLPSLPSDSQVKLLAENLKISFPSMIVFNTAEFGNAPFRYEAQDNSIIIDGDIPEKVSLPIEKIMIVPQDNGSGTIVAQGQLAVTGGIVINEAAVTKADIDRITLDDSTVSFSAKIPEMLPSNVGINTYTMDNLDFKIDLDLSSLSESIPEQLKSVGRISLKDVYINLGLDMNKLMSQIDADIDLNVSVSLPKIIKISDSRVVTDAETGRGVLTLPANLTDGKVVVDPIKIDALDLSGINLSEGIKDSIKVAGGVTLSNVNIDTDVLGKTHQIDVKAGICSVDENGDATDEIIVSNVAAKVDYQMEPMSMPLDLSTLTEMLSGNGLTADLDINRFHVAVELATNVVLPLNLALDIVPYYNGVADPSAFEPISLPVNTAEVAGQTQVTKYWISNKTAPGEYPDGYVPVFADLVTLLRSMPEKLDVSFAGGTDANTDAVIALDHDMVLKADYEVALPLELGENFEISYQGQFDGLPSVISQVLAYGDIAIVGEIINSLPLQLDIQFALLNSLGEEISLAEGSGYQTIASSSLGAPSVTDLNIAIVKGEDADVSDISSIAFKVTGSSGNAAGVALKKEDFLKLELRVLLPSGVGVDAGELIGLGAENEEN